MKTPDSTNYRFRLELSEIETDGESKQQSIRTIGHADTLLASIVFTDSTVSPESIISAAISKRVPELLKAAGVTIQSSQ